MRYLMPGLDLADPPGTGPKITQVRVSGSAWANGFKIYLDSAFSDTTNRGYKIPNGVNQSKTLPWININRISITFDKAVSLSLSAFSLSGIPGTKPDGLGGFIPSSIPSIASYTYNASTLTATLILSASIETATLTLTVVADRVRDTGGRRLWGNWTNNSSTISGTTGVPSDFIYQFRVLVGDANQDASVTSADSTFANSQTGTLLTNGTRIGTWSEFADINGSAGIIGTDDKLNISTRIGTTL